tara:strand:- start:359 stop:2167 length:1809 start_codon:yes stop_codon:yes gene_type:complete
MKNIPVKQESLSNWREEFDIDEAKVDDKHSPEGKEKERNKRKYGNWPVSQGAQTSVRRGIHWSNRGDKKRRGAKVEEGIEGGISVETLTKDTKFLEVETVDIIKPEPIKGASNWKLEMVTEMLISEGYNDDEIVTILTEELPKVPLGGIVTGAVRAAWNLSSKGVKGAYDLGKGVRNVLNRGVKDTKLTKDIITTARKLRNPDGISVTNNPLTKGGGSLLKSFKGFMQNVKKSGSNLIDRTKGKLKRTDIKTSTPTTSTKPVEVLGGAATNPTATVKPLKNITPSPIGDGIKKVANQIKTGATVAATGGVVAGSKLTGSSPSKVITAKTDGTGKSTDLPKAVDLPKANDKKLTNPETGKEIDPVPLPGVKSIDKGDVETSAPKASAPAPADAESKSSSVTPPAVKKDEAPITNDGKKEVDPSKNEKIDTPLTKRELRNKRNAALSSKEGRRTRRDAALQAKKDSGFPSRRIKSGTPVNQLFNKEEAENIQELDNMGGPAAIGAIIAGAAGLAKSAYTGIKNTAENLKKNKEQKQQKIKDLTQSYSWRDELGLIEGNRTRYKGVGLSGSGNPKDYSKGPNEKVFVDYTKIRAKAPVKTDTKVG